MPVITANLQFDANGGSGAPATIQKIVNISAANEWIDFTLPSTQPVKAFSSFVGWGASSSTLTTFAPGSTFSWYISSSPGTQYKTLYAIWNVQAVQITFNANGGSGAPSSIVVSKGATITIPKQKPTRTNYIFMYWSINIDGKTYRYNPGETFALTTENRTFVANWAKDGSKFDTVPTFMQMDGTTQYTITINKSPHADHHTLLIKLGNREQQIDNVDSSVTTSIPLAWCNALPNRASWDATVYLTTYDNDDNVVGSVVEAKISMRVPSSIIPQATLSTAVSGNAVTVQWNRYVQGFSSVSFSISAQGVYSSTIKKIEISGGGFSHKSSYDSANVSVTITSGVINLSGSITFLVKITDSRSRVKSFQETITFDSYFRPTIASFESYRSDAQGNRDDFEGAYICVILNSVQVACSEDNDYTILLEYKQYRAQSYTTLSNDAQLNTNYIFQASTAGTYLIHTSIEDDFGEQSEQTTIVQSVVGSLSLGLNNDRARFGGAVRQAGLEVDWESKFNSRIIAYDHVQRGFVSSQSLSAGGQVSGTVTYPNGDFSAIPNVVATLYSGGSYIGNVVVSLYSITVSGFKYRLENNTQNAVSVGIIWVAIL